MKNHSNPTTAHRGIIFIASCLSVFFALVLNGCSVSPKHKESTESLISADSPIFDKRFQEVSFKDLNLDNFWVEREDQKKMESIPITNNTFADLTDKVKNGVVNIYTLRIEERNANFGISPNDIIPFRIPLVSTIFEIIPFQVPISFNTQGLSLGSGFIIN